MPRSGPTLASVNSGMGISWPGPRDLGCCGDTSGTQSALTGRAELAFLTMALSPEYELPGHDEAWRSEDKLPSLFSFLVGPRDGTQA